MSRLTPEQEKRQQIIEQARSPRGGWSRDQLAAWGVAWPPPKGWKRQLVLNGHPLLDV